jgi:hypothetical protein
MSVHSSSNTYSQIAVEFIRQIRQYNESAAACIDQIQAQYGTRAAYLASFALLDLKHRQLKRHYNPTPRDVHAFTYCEEMGEIAEALQLYEAAVTHLLSD